MCVSLLYRTRFRDKCGYVFKFSLSDGIRVLLPISSLKTSGTAALYGVFFNGSVVENSNSNDRMKTIRNSYSASKDGP